MRSRKPILPKVREALWVSLAVFPLVMMVAACGSTKPTEEPAEGPTEAVETQAPPAPSEPLDTPAKPEAPPEKPTAGPPPPPAEGEVSVDQLMTADKTVQENVTAVKNLLRAVREKLGVFDLPEGDERRSDETWVRFETGRERLAKLYKDGSFSEEDHRTLCLTLAGLGKSFGDLATQHCDVYLRSADPLGNPVQYSMALSTTAEIHNRAGDYEEAEQLYLKYLETYCDAPLDRDVRTRVTPNCRRILTQQLPKIHHESGNVRALEDTLARCWAMNFERDHDLLTIRKFLLEDLWQSDDLAGLDKLAGELLTKNVWGEKASKTNLQLMAPAISARSRALLLQKSCFSARQVYLDYDFDHSNIDTTWRRDNVLAPSRLLCRPAPKLTVSNWSGGKTPAPAAGKLTLIHFVDAKIRGSLEGLVKLKGIAERHRQQVQVIALVVVGERIYPPGATVPKRGLEPDAFKKEFDALSAEHELKFPVGYLSGTDDPAATLFLVQRFPTTILIGKDGTLLAYHPLVSLDAGWETLVEELGK